MEIGQDSPGPLVSDLLGDPTSEMSLGLLRFAEGLTHRFAEVGVTRADRGSALADQVADRWVLPQALHGGLEVVDTAGLDGLLRRWTPTEGYDQNDFFIDSPKVIPVDPVEHPQGLPAESPLAGTLRGRALVPVQARRAPVQAKASQERWRAVESTPQKRTLSPYPATMGRAGAVDASMLRFPDARATVQIADRQAVVAEQGPAARWSPSAEGMAPAAQAAETLTRSLLTQQASFEEPVEAAPVAWWLIEAGALDEALVEAPQTPSAPTSSSAPGPHRAPEAAAQRATQRVTAQAGWRRAEGQAMAPIFQQAAPLEPADVVMARMGVVEPIQLSQSPVAEGVTPPTAPQTAAPQTAVTLTAAAPQIGPSAQTPGGRTRSRALSVGRRASRRVLPQRAVIGRPGEAGARTRPVFERQAQDGLGAALIRPEAQRASTPASGGASATTERPSGRASAMTSSAGAVERGQRAAVPARRAGAQGSTRVAAREQARRARTSTGGVASQRAPWALPGAILQPAEAQQAGQRARSTTGVTRAVASMIRGASSVARAAEHISRDRGLTQFLAARPGVAPLPGTGHRAEQTASEPAPRAVLTTPALTAATGGQRRTSGPLAPWWADVETAQGGLAGAGALIRRVERVAPAGQTRGVGSGVARQAIAVAARGEQLAPPSAGVPTGSAPDVVHPLPPAGAARDRSTLHTISSAVTQPTLSGSTDVVARLSPSLGARLLQGDARRLGRAALTQARRLGGGLIGLPPEILDADLRVETTTPMMRALARLTEASPTHALAFEGGAGDLIRPVAERADEASAAAGSAPGAVARRTALGEPAAMGLTRPELQTRTAAPTVGEAALTTPVALSTAAERPAEARGAMARLEAFLGSVVVLEPEAVVPLMRALETARPDAPWQAVLEEGAAGALVHRVQPEAPEPARAAAPQPVVRARTERRATPATQRQPRATAPRRTPSPSARLSAQVDGLIDRITRALAPLGRPNTQRSGARPTAQAPESLGEALVAAARAVEQTVGARADAVMERVARSPLVEGAAERREPSDVEPGRSPAAHLDSAFIADSGAGDLVAQPSVEPVGVSGPQTTAQRSSTVGVAQASSASQRSAGRSATLSQAAPAIGRTAARDARLSAAMPSPQILDTRGERIARWLADRGASGAASALPGLAGETLLVTLGALAAGEAAPEAIQAGLRPRGAAPKRERPGARLTGSSASAVALPMVSTSFSAPSSGQTAPGGFTGSVSSLATEAPAGALIAGAPAGRPGQLGLIAEATATRREVSTASPLEPLNLERALIIQERAETAAAQRGVSVMSPPPRARSAPTPGALAWMPPAQSAVEALAASTVGDTVRPEAPRTPRVPPIMLGSLFGDRGPELSAVRGMPPPPPTRTMVDTARPSAESVLRSTPGGRPEQQAETSEEARHRTAKNQIDEDLSPEQVEEIAEEVIYQLMQSIELDAHRFGEDEWD